MVSVVEPELLEQMWTTTGNKPGNKQSQKFKSLLNYLFVTAWSKCNHMHMASRVYRHFEAAVLYAHFEQLHLKLSASGFVCFATKQ